MKRIEFFSVLASGWRVERYQLEISIDRDAHSWNNLKATYKNVTWSSYHRLLRLCRTKYKSEYEHTDFIIDGLYTVRFFLSKD